MLDRGAAIIVLAEISFVLSFILVPLAEARSEYYAYVADADNGVLVYDLSDEENPELISQYESNGTNELLYFWGRIFTSNEASGFELLNFQDLDDPSLDANFDTSGTAEAVAVFPRNVVDMVYDGSYGSLKSYIADGEDGMQAIDLSDPYNPTDYGSYNTDGYAYDVDVVWDDSNNKLVVLIADGSKGMEIIYRRSSGEWRFRDKYNTDGTAKAVISNEFDDRAYVADGNSGLTILDISDKEVINFVSSYDTDGDAQDVYYMEGGYELVYVADGENGVVVVDVSDEENPSEAAQLDIGANDNVIGLYGDWLLDDRIFLIDETYGLVVLDISDPESPEIISSTTEGMSDPQSVYVRDEQNLWPEVFPITPEEEETLEGTYNVSWKTTDFDGDSYTLELYARSEDTGDKYLITEADYNRAFMHEGSYEWNTTRVPDGGYVLYALYRENGTETEQAIYPYFEVNNILLSFAEVDWELYYNTLTLTYDPDAEVDEAEARVRLDAYREDDEGDLVYLNSTTRNHTVRGQARDEFNLSWTATGPGVYHFEVSLYDNESRLQENLTIHNVTLPVNRPPTVAITQVAPAEPGEGEVVGFTAIANDADGDPLDYAWDFGDGAVVTGDNLSAVSHVYYTISEVFEMFTVALTVNDGNGSAVNTSLALRVWNRPPVIHELIIPEGEEGALLRFRVRADDPGNDTLYYWWDYGDGNLNASGPANATLHRYAADGTYDLTVTVGDGFAQVSANATVTVRNAAPVIVAIDAPARGDEGATLTFSVNASDPGNDPLTYVWLFGDGDSATGRLATHAFADDGDYNITVTVTDGDGGVTNATLPVRVLNVAPVITEIIFPTFPTNSEGEPIAFTARAGDPGDDTLAYAWDLGDGTLLAGAEVTHTFLDDGFFTLRLRVTDGDGGVATEFRIVTVANTPPTITAVSHEPATDLTEGATVAFSVAASDPGNDPLGYNWSFGDGNEATGMTVAHAFRDDGDFTVVVTVDDGDGGEASETLYVSVANLPPELVAVTYSSTGGAGQRLVFSVEATDPGDDPVAVTWYFGDGSIEKGSEAVHTYGKGGSYSGKVCASDGEGGEACEEFTIAVAEQEPRDDRGIPAPSLLVILAALVVVSFMRRRR